MSCLDWKTGQPNAKYCKHLGLTDLFNDLTPNAALPRRAGAINMLANALGSGPKSFLNATITIAGPPPPPIQPGATASGCWA